VWNDSSSDPQQLGRVLLRRIASLKGNLDGFVEQFIEGCTEGWIALDKAERIADPIGFFGGRFDGIVATCDPAVNEYDQIYGTRKDRVEVIWPIAARGHSQ